MKEIKFSLLGKEYSVRPEFRKIANLEAVTGKGTLELMHSIGEQKFKIVELCQVLQTMAGDKKLTVEKIGEAVTGNVNEFITPVIEFLAACNVGSDELAGDEPEESAEKND